MRRRIPKALLAFCLTTSGVSTCVAMVLANPSSTGSLSCRSLGSPAFIALPGVAAGGERGCRLFSSMEDVAIGLLRPTSTTEANSAFEKARVAIGRFDYAGALRVLDAAAETDPRSPDLASGYGMVYLAAEEPERAARYFNEALGLDPTNRSAIIGLAGVDVLRRDCKKA